MKNQYFGDISDYRKYGLLRVLSQTLTVKIGVCWMLTQDDGSSDGRKIEYFSEPLEWRKYDPVIFDAMKSYIEIDHRYVQNVEHGNFIPNSVYFTQYLSDNVDHRELYLKSMLDYLAETDLIFLDPDNGLEIKSVKKGRKRSNKYVYWDELQQIADHTPSILLYQHFRRQGRDEMIKEISIDLLSRLGVIKVMYFHTPDVVFFLATKSTEIIQRFDEIAANIASRWGEQFQVGVYNE